MKLWMGLFLIGLNGGLAGAEESVVGRVINRKTGDEIRSVCATRAPDGMCFGYRLELYQGELSYILGGDKNLFAHAPENIARKIRKLRRRQIENELINPHDFIPLAFSEDRLGNPVRVSQKLWNSDLPIVLKVPMTAGSGVADLLVDADIIATAIVLTVVEPFIFAGDEFLALFGSLRTKHAVNVLLGGGDGEVTLSDRNFSALVKALK